MAFISRVTECVSFNVGKQLDAFAHCSKRYLIVAGLITGWAVGLFFASKAFMPKPAAFALMSICSYAFAHLASDVISCTHIFARWLLSHGGEQGKRDLSSLSVSTV